MGLDIMVWKLKKYDKESDGCNYILSRETFPAWCKKLETDITNTRYDWKKYIIEKEIDPCKVISSSSKTTEKGKVITINFIDGTEHIVDLSEVPVKVVSQKVIGVEEVGYQRKGLNDKFYDDSRKGELNYYVWALDELNHYKNEYCNETDEYGIGYNPKVEFQKNIIDKFIEGQCVVVFDF